RHMDTIATAVWGRFKWPILHLPPREAAIPQHSISTTVSTSTPTQASSRIDPTQTSTLPSGASSEADPSPPVTAVVPPQTNPHARTTTRCPERGRPSRPPRTMTSSVPLRYTSFSNGEWFSIGHPRVEGAMLDRLAGFRIISNYGVGVDHIVLADAAARRIPVGNTPGVLDGATADMAFALLLASARRLVEGDRYARSPGFTVY